jgi:hypothetical protein
MEPMFRSVFGRQFAIALSAILLSVAFVPILTFPDIAFADGLLVSLTPNSGPSDTPVAIAGSGWFFGDEICAYMDDRGSNALTCTTVGSDGTFAASFQVPQLLSAGAHTIYVEDEYKPDQTTTTTFTVTTHPAQVGHPFQPQPDLNSPQEPPSGQIKSLPDKPNHLQLVPHQDCGGKHWDHCHWLEADASINDPDFVIVDFTTGTWHTAHQLFPIDIQEWCSSNCAEGKPPSSHSQFGIHTTWTRLNQDWMSRQWMIYYS